MGAMASAAELAQALQRLEEQTRRMLRQYEEGTPMAYCGCLTEISIPADAAESDELSLLFDQAEVADDVPVIVHSVVCAEEVLAIKGAASCSCIGDALVERVMCSTLLEISDEEVEYVGYLGWASHGNLQHM